MRREGSASDERPPSGKPRSGAERGNQRRALVDLFPDEPEDDGRRVLVLIGVVVLAVVALARQTGAPATDTLWAEDGTFFLGDAVRRSFASTLLRPLGGYAHVTPRLLGEVASWLPLRTAAWVLSGGAAVVVALVGAVVYLASSGLLRTRTARFVVAVAPVLLPIASFEVLNTAANLHFVLLYGAFWALLWVPRRWSGRVAAAALLLLTTTSDPQSVLLVPLALARLCARRSWRDHVTTAAFGVGLATQLLVDATTSRGFGERAPVDQLARLYPLRVVSALAGGRVVDPVWRVLGDGLTVLAALALVALVAVTWRRPLVVAAGLGSLVYWVGPLAFRWSERMRPTDDAIGLNGSRYGMVPALLVLVIVVVAVERAGRRPMGVAALTLAVVFAAVGYRSDNGRTDGPRWRAGVAAATATCRAEPAPATVEIAISPQSGWKVTLPCARLDHR